MSAGPSLVANLACKPIRTLVLYKGRLPLNDINHTCLYACKVSCKCCCVRQACIRKKKMR